MSEQFSVCEMPQATSIVCHDTCLARDVIVAGNITVHPLMKGIET